ncbi:hypothetical protein AB833_07745 [Chromatiales bacterium (ex Bugula neritina AB1)]|nr:hypothetical protein AB833_07745 [Chromatiales bacterium (ex Bugula neritina AB1)]
MSEKSKNSIVLFGARTPLIGDYVDSCLRLGLKVAAIINVDQRPDRLPDRSRLIAIDEVSGNQRTLPYVPAAFSPVRRRQLRELASVSGFENPLALVDSSAVVAGTTAVGEGSYVNALTAVGSSSRIGQFVFINRSTNIGHHVMIGDYASIGPGVSITSSVLIGEGAMVGAGATLLPGVRIGAGAVVAAATRVHTDVPDNTLAIGSALTLKPIREGSRIMDYSAQE